MKIDKFQLTQDQVDLLDSIIYDEKDLNLLREQVKKYITYGYPIEILAKNWTAIKNLGKDSSSLNSYHIRYGQELGDQLFAKKTESSTRTKEDFINKYGKDEAIRKLKSLGASLENYINRHGEELGKIKWQQYCEKRKKSFAKGREQNKYASRDLNWFQARYGKEEGYRVWNQKRQNQAYKVSRQYYIDRYGIDEGTRLCKQAKTRTIEGFIEKYGFEDGVRRYNAWITNRVASLKSRKSFSKWAMYCCDMIKEQIQDLFYYGNNELIWGLPNHYRKLLKQKMVSPDLFYKGKIIEFQGDRFHGNPTMFKNEDRPNPFRKNLTAGEIRSLDKIRIEYYISKGYTVLEIWESEFNDNQHEVINKCLEFLR